MAEPWTNWAGNVRFHSAHQHAPTSIGELQALVAQADQVRVLGSGHSFNRIADTDGQLVSVAALPPVIDIDTARSQVRVSGGLRYGQVTARIDAAGLALSNLGSLPHISIAGAAATGTHGSGSTNQVLAAAARSVELITADGERVEIDATDESFPGCVLALGALGVTTALTLQLVPTFTVAQYVYEGFRLSTLIDHLDDVLDSAYSVSLFTTFAEHGRNLAWTKHRLDDDSPPPPSEWLGGQLATAAHHPLEDSDPQPATEQLGRPGPWHARLPHFRLEFTPSNGDELQSEYFVPRASGADAVRAVAALREQIQPLLMVSEIRRVAADELWLSPSYQRDTTALHFTWVNDEVAVTPVLTAIESALAPFAVAPHWGKVFTSSPAAIAARYPRLADFAQLAARLDPPAKFSNDFIRRYVRP